MFEDIYEQSVSKLDLGIHLVRIKGKMMLFRRLAEIQSVQTCSS
jgi:hypothetical protein